MEYTYKWLQNIKNDYGEAFHVLDVNHFIENYRELLSAFRGVYPGTVIAYSYKTNYIPKLCRAVNEIGGYAEVVSHMELELARRIGVRPEEIVFNGPYKQPDAMKALLLDGGTIHLDSLQELDLLQSIAKENPDRQLNIGVRVNFPIGDGVVSRFGIDAQGGELRHVFQMIEKSKNINLRTLHCHFASRSLETWKPRAEGMLKLIEAYGIRPECIDLGGGMYGKMDNRLKRQFQEHIPTYQEYAQVVGEVFQARLNGDYRPTLMIEPGSALVGDCMDLVSKVQSVKTVQGQRIATVLASTQNLRMGLKTPPTDVVADEPQGLNEGPTHIAGYTCIENDYLVRDYSGPIAAGDYVVFRNVGSYSVVMKPPFIMPSVPILELNEDGTVELVRRAEDSSDVFQTYV